MAWRIHPSRGRLIKAGLAVVLSAVSTGPLHAVIPAIQLKPVAVGQFYAPTTVTPAGDGSGRLFISEQRGKILVFADGAVLPVPFIDLSAKLVALPTSYDERGLLGLAFHPDYGVAGAPGQGRFYVFYNAPSPNAPGTTADPVNCRSVLAEYRVSTADPNLADPASERILLSFDKPQFNHNGGQLAFGPLDGMLYLSTGDGGAANDNDAGHTGGNSTRPSGVLGNAQDLAKLLGKLLRIDPLGTNGPGGQYGIPADNPFVAEGGGVRAEIYAYGLRNPWRFSFDSGPGGTNRLFLADVGQNKFEEINLITAGGNYGWRRYEAFADVAATTPSAGPFIAPVAAYAHPGQAGSSGLMEVGLSVTGGRVYRGSTFPALQGKYVFADWSTSFNTPNGTLLGLEETSPGAFTLSKLNVTGGNPIGRYIYTFGTDEAGELYVATKITAGTLAPAPGGVPSGQLFKIVPDTPIAYTRREIWEAQFYSAGTYLAPDGDADSDRIGNLLEYAWNLNPTTPQSLGDFYGVSNDAQAGFTTIVFRRDPRATDLTYVLETSSDLAQWYPVVTSSAGGVPSGPAYLSEAADPADPETLRVVAQLPFSPAGQTKRFVRLSVRRP